MKCVILVDDQKNTGIGVTAPLYSQSAMGAAMSAARLGGRFFLSQGAGWHYE